MPSNCSKNHHNVFIDAYAAMVLFANLHTSPNSLTTKLTAISPCIYSDLPRLQKYFQMFLPSDSPSAISSNSVIVAVNSMKKPLGTLHASLVCKCGIVETRSAMQTKTTQVCVPSCAGHTEPHIWSRKYLSTDEEDKMK